MAAPPGQPGISLKLYTQGLFFIIYFSKCWPDVFEKINHLCLGKFYLFFSAQNLIMEVKGYFNCVLRPKGQKVSKFLFCLILDYRSCGLLTVVSDDR